MCPCWDIFGWLFHGQASDHAWSFRSFPFNTSRRRKQLAYSAYPAILAALAPRIRFSLHKEFRDGEIRLYLHKEFRAAELGGDASENGDFQREKQRLQGYKFFQGLGDPSGGGLRIVSGGAWGDNKGDDATENDNFQRGKQRLQGPKIFPRASKGGHSICRDAKNSS